MVASWRPDIAVQVAFNADPNDPNAVPAWTDLSVRFRAASRVTTGRQYELDQNQASQPTMSFLDQDEWLNPANTVSPYSPNVVPYRQILWQAMWPNTTAGNVLNLGYGSNLDLHTTAGYDPSFESYTIGAAVPWITGVGPALPVISTVTPRTGTKDLLWTVAAGFGTQGASWVIPCIPGRQYTLSGYVWQNSASTQQISVVGVATGTTTTTINAYVRLTVTFTATQPTHVAQVVTTGAVLTGAVRLDDIQLDQGSSATAFTTTGPVIYGVLRDFVERWPSRWDHMGFLGEAAVTLVDAFGPQNLIGLWAEYRNALLALFPDYYWPLDEPSGSATFSEQSGRHGPSLTRLDGPNGPGATFGPGTQLAFPGDQSATGLACDTGGATTNIPASVAQAGWTSATSQINIGGPLPAAYTISFWAAWGPHQVDFPRYGLELGQAGLGRFSHVTDFYTFNAPANLFSHSVWPGGDAFGGATDIWADGKPHLIVITTSLSVVSGTVRLYVDGTQVGTQNGGGYTGTSPHLLNYIQLGGIIDPGNFGFYGGAAPEITGAIYAHLALWNRELSPAQITGLWNAGKGFPGETSGQRLARYLSYGWSGSASIDTGQSIMGVSNLTAGTKLLAANQGVATTENGNYWVDSNGTTTFAARTRRYLETTSLYTFGEREDLGEYPYMGDIAFDLDPTLVFNNVEVDNFDGVTAVAKDAASQRAYFPRQYQRSINVLDNNEAVDASTYLLNQHKDPHLRVQSIVLNAASNPNLWPVVLSLKIGQRVTVKRRAKAANGGTGLTIQADFFVEQISVEQVDMRAGLWTYRLYLSPIDLNQVGILDNGTFGRLGTGGAKLQAGISAGATAAVVDLTGGDLFTTTGTPFAATIDSEIVTVTAVSGVSSPQTFTITRPTDGTASAHSAAAPVQTYQPFVLAY